MYIKVMNRKNPINRNQMFFSKSDFEMEIELARDYMEHDMNQTVVLFEVDLQKTNTNDIYHEASKTNIRFKPPVELTVRYEIQSAEMRAYGKSLNKGVYAKPGILDFTVLNATLEEVGRDIKRGDYIGVQVTPEEMIYFTVFDDGKVASYANANSLYGVKPFYRQIKCNYVDPAEFEG
jgi:activator of HSP90 ATPase